MPQTIDFPKIPTLDSLNEHSVMETIRQLMLLYRYAHNPNKPRQPNTFDSKSAMEYGASLAEYESQKVDYDNANALAKEHNSDVDRLIVRYIQLESGLNTIPAQYQDKVYSFAWDKGRSAGYYEVYSYLTDLVEIFG